MNEICGTYAHRGYIVELTYCSADRVVLIKVTGPGRKRPGLADAQSVDEVIEIVDDLIDVMEAPGLVTQFTDHESAANEIAARDRLNDQDAALVREMLGKVQAERDAITRPYMEHRGYQAPVRYLHDEGTFEAAVEGSPIDPIRARSIRSLNQRFELAIDAYLARAGRELRL